MSSETRLSSLVGDSAAPAMPSAILPGPPAQLLRDVTGIDANAPIDPLGNLRPQVVSSPAAAPVGCGSTSSSVPGRT